MLSKMRGMPIGQLKILVEYGLFGIDAQRIARVAVVTSG
jgi:hypothetical protein